MRAESEKSTMLTLVGEGVSPGLAEGRAFVYIDLIKKDSTLYRIDDARVDEEKARIDKAIDDVRQSLTIDAKQIEGQLGKGSAGIFLAQRAMLLDRSVVDELKRTLEAERVNAEQIVKTVFGLLAGRFRELSDEVLRERGDDIDDLSRRLLLALAGIHAHTLESLPANTVLVARQLLPSDTVFLSRSTTVAVLAEFAGRAAHAALLARELGIPCVGGVPKLLETVHTGDVVLVDGSEGKAVINPDSRALQKYEDALSEVRRRNELLAQGHHAGRAVTLDVLEGDYHVCVHRSCRSKHCAKDGLVLVGDALTFLDPVFSTGMYLTLVSGVAAADAVIEGLREGDVSGKRFVEYGEEMTRRIETLRRLVYAFYAPDFSFRQLIMEYPYLKGAVTDCLVGNLDQDLTALHEALAEFLDLPEPIEHGRAKI